MSVKKKNSNFETTGPKNDNTFKFASRHNDC